MKELLNVKDDALAELKEQLIAKKESLANLDVSIQRHCVEMKTWKEESQKELDRISGLQQEIAQKLEGLVVKRSSMSNQLVQNSSSTMTSFVEKPQTMLQELAGKDKMIDELQEDNAKYKAELNEAKHVINQQKLELLSTKQKLANNEKEIMYLKQQLRVKEEALADLNENEMIEKLRVKDEALAKLNNELILEKNSFDAAVTKHSNELEGLKKETQEQSEKLLTLQKDAEEKEEQLVTAKNTISNLRRELTQHSDLLTTEKADKQSMQRELADKNQFIKELQSVIATYKVEVKDTKNLLSQLEMECSVLKQKCADNEEKMEKKTRVKDETLAEAKEEVLVKQYCLNDMSTKGSDELKEWKKESQEQLNKISDLQEKIAAKEKELAVTESEMSNLHHRLVQQTDLLSSITTSYADKEQTFQNALADKERIIEQLRADNATVEKKLTAKEEELQMSRKEMSQELVKQSDLLNIEIVDKQKMKDALASNKQKINWRVVDKLEQDNQTYRAQLEDAEDLIQQMKMEQSSMQQHLTDIEKEMIGRIRIKEEEMVELKKELMMKQKSFDDAVSKHSDELEGLQKVSQNQVLALQKSIVGKEEEIDTMRNEVSNLHDQLANKSSELSAEMEDKQIIKFELTDKEKMIDMLQADATVELNDAKELISQLELEGVSMKQQLANNQKEILEIISDKDEMLAKLKEELITKQDSLADMNSTIRRHTSELEEWQKESQEQLDKILSLQQEVAEKGEELTLTKSEMYNLHHQLVQQSDQLSTALIDYTDKEKAFQRKLADKQRIIDTLQSDIEMYTVKLNDSKDLMQQLKTEQLFEEQQLEKQMMEKLQMKDKALAALEEQLIAKQSILDDTISRHSVELMAWKKNFEEQSNSYSTLQREMMEKEEELVAARKEISDQNDKLMQQSDLAACTQTMKLALNDKDRIISELEEDIVRQQTEANNTKHQLSQLEREYLSVKQELDSKTKEVGEKHSARSQALAKLKEETFAKQNSLVDSSDFKKQSIELDMLKMKYQGQLDKIKSLKKDVHMKSEELFATTRKVDDLNRQLKQQSTQMNEAIADKDRTIIKLQAEMEMYKVELNDTKGLISQTEFKVEPSSVKQELEEKEMLESELEAKQSIGASNVQNQEKQLPDDKPTDEQDIKRKEVKVVPAKVQPVQRVNDKVMPNKIQPLQRANDIMKDSCKEVSHYQHIHIEHIALATDTALVI